MAGRNEEKKGGSSPAAEKKSCDRTALASAYRGGVGLCGAMFLPDKTAADVTAKPVPTGP